MKLEMKENEISNRLENEYDWEGYRTRKVLNLLYIFAIIIIVFACSGVMMASPNTSLYNAYISGRMDHWEKETSKLIEISEKSQSLVTKNESLEAMYGIIAFKIGTGDNAKARQYLEKADLFLKELMVKNPDDAKLHAYKAAFYGFKIGLNPLKAPILGIKSIESVEKAYAIDPTSPQVLLEKANIKYYSPSFYGGSKTEALILYLKAARQLELQKNNKQNWIYLTILTNIANIYKETGQTLEAIRMYNKILAVEPQFIWVRDQLYPELIREN